MALPDVGDNPRYVENLSVGGGYDSPPDGGMDVDGEGNFATNGDGTVEGDLEVGGFLSIGSPETVIVSDGAITITGSHHLVDTEGLASTDELETINGGPVGTLLVLRAVSTNRKTLLKTGVDNIFTGTDYNLDNTSRAIMLIREANGWKILDRT